MGKNKVKGVITLVLGLLWIIAGLIWLVVSKEPDWTVGGMCGIGITDIVFSIFMMFQPTEEDVIEKLKQSGYPGFGSDGTVSEGPKETVQFIAPEELSDEAPSFDPVTGEPLKK
ncbi:MAG: hypothetical protein IJL98_03530 [Lachnospiraceae bacterium]|nr:hypothetical protein [Lachnospiraceae bacterium]